MGDINKQMKVQHLSQTGKNPKGFPREMVAEPSLRNMTNRNPPKEGVQIVTSTHGVISGIRRTLTL